ncbi:type II toxin-antitoxin system Phd/YefM family antitoxin [Sulfurovum sp. bin170]|uniref:type II toxin-antitoxin system Phd/YefM family antitoxin n=1 Tax=Sulfurovum sp. bin170 TaxID=2695268 RepID=UPI0013E04C86|nr:type II toxin-antitoxin system Phd/YefM family antitoxin [Sulfurovum sp. bin170]NEW60358.1 type II toxin-antitoxin system Phd/YefM family antitoxin [Sulfurovum sp. bin170]
MVAYASNELISSSDFAKKFGSYLAQIKSNTVEKLAILKNNYVEAVLVSKDDYEKMKLALEEKEHRELYGSLDFRENQKMFQEIYADIVSGKERLTPYHEGMDEIDEMIDKIEHENSKK